MNTKYCQGSKLIIKYVNSIFPKADYMLKRQRLLFEEKSRDILERQALSDLSPGKHHNREAGIYALYPGVELNNALKFIVSFQALDYYLDFLCTRSQVKDETTFSQIYISLRDAVDPKRKISSSHLSYLNNDDINCINEMIEKCRREVVKLPSYNLVMGPIKKFVQMYSDFQTYVHLDKDLREERIKVWADRHLEKQLGISYWEMCAASGSTLLIFVLFACAYDPKLTQEEVENICVAYYPWICGLQVLLQHFVDANDDIILGSFNLTNYYENLKKCEDRISFFMEHAVKSCDTLKYPEFHRTLVMGITAIYLSNPKAKLGMNRLASSNLLKKGGSKTNFYHSLLRFLRFSGKL
ncbi:MAG: DUF2600 family protein [Bacillota bacterium]